MKASLIFMLSLLITNLYAQSGFEDYSSSYPSSSSQMVPGSQDFEATPTPSDWEDPSSMDDEDEDEEDVLY